MKQTTSNSGRKFWSSMLCGVLSLVLNFIVLPQVFTLSTRLGFPVPDPLWISLMIVIPVIPALCLLERKNSAPPKYVWLGLPAQYLLLIVFAAPLSKSFGSDSWTYLWDAAVWPLGVTAAQFAVLTLRFRRRKSR
jgi:hypothetical protein